MAQANSTLNLVPLDFTTLKNAFKVFMKGQSNFKSYNFDAPNLSVLIDLLSYNSFYQAIYLNMVASEMFLDSSQLRDSEVSHAKELNYVPRSNISASIDIKVTINTGNSSQTSVLIPQYSTFTGRIGSNNYTFSTNAAITGASTNNIIAISSMTIYEGDLAVDSFPVDYSNNFQRFILSNPGIDTSSLNINVLSDGGSSDVEYLLARSLFGLNANSNVYFLQAAANGQYEVVFGDGVVGKPPPDGSIVSAIYRVGRGSAPNGLSNITVNGALGGYSNSTITVLGPATGGANAETDSSIKFNAPRAFAAQGRAVSDPDYETLLQTNFPEIQAIAAYGGDTLVPAQYGKVFVAIKINGVDGLPSSLANTYSQFLSDKTYMTVEIVSPTFLFVGVKTNIKYNINVTQSDPETISSEVSAAIFNFANVNLDDFKSTLYYSQFCAALDAADQSIIGDDTELTLISYLSPIGGLVQSFTINYLQPLVSNLPSLGNTYSANIQHTITSTPFIVNGRTCILEDDNNGNMLLVQSSGNSHSVIGIVGTVNYSQGVAQINNIKPQTSDTIKLYARTAELDISTSQNVILEIKPGDISINVESISA